MDCVVRAETYIWREKWDIPRSRKLTDTIDAWHKRSTRVFSSEKQRRRARNINCELKRELQILKWDENFRGVIQI